MSQPPEPDECLPELTEPPAQLVRVEPHDYPTSEERYADEYAYLRRGTEGARGHGYP
ncbi:MAG: hypothetical protein ABWX96_21295 [Propionibacteriaceae bacterium]